MHPWGGRFYKNWQDRLTYMLGGLFLFLYTYQWKRSRFCFSPTSWGKYGAAVLVSDLYPPSLLIASFLLSLVAWVRFSNSGRKNIKRGKTFAHFWTLVIRFKVLWKIFLPLWCWRAQKLSIFTPLFFSCFVSYFVHYLSIICPLFLFLSIIIYEKICKDKTKKPWKINIFLILQNIIKCQYPIMWIGDIKQKKALANSLQRL